MPILLVRHAVAMRRRGWPNPDRRRPLTPMGHAQAEALVDVLSPFDVRRVLSSPFVRCLETVEPLAMRLGLPVEVVPALGEGAGAEAAEMDFATGGSLVLCSHGDVIPELFGALWPRAAYTEGGFPCEKGSTWVVSAGGGTEDDLPSAQYLPPPEVG